MNILKKTFKRVWILSILFEPLFTLLSVALLVNIVSDSKNASISVALSNNTIFIWIFVKGLIFLILEKIYLIYLCIKHKGKLKYLVWNIFFPWIFSLVIFTNLSGEDTQENLHYENNLLKQYWKTNSIRSIIVYLLFIVLITIATVFYTKYKSFDTKESPALLVLSILGMMLLNLSIFVTAVAIVLIFYFNFTKYIELKNKVDNKTQKHLLLNIFFPFLISPLKVSEKL